MSRKNRGPADGAVVVATTNLLAALVLDNDNNFRRGSHFLFLFLFFGRGEMEEEVMVGARKSSFDGSSFIHQ